ncbi:DUF2911 domain-containing protein [Algoriphagus sediminis]|uniref:DUF2911 domain-containing protein n=1 Tax=Algoriphagus sediminis TaxID=3057113 RepID=A0ABT7YAQ3_9BACT|nr:DUF2911 domain-containing protein [Algoriphagus sediminis]MDN3203601.1 DUF2911 domain-containing protein [Algoriphagus sediminis]
MKIYQKTLLSVFIFFFGISLVAHAQLNMPQASPSARLAQKVGLTDVTVDYSRPSMKGRKIFGTLVPYNEVWRTGANAATKLNFSTEVEIGGAKLPAGSYALYSIPGKSEWTIILSKNTELWGAMGYSDADDVVRFKVKPSKTGKKYETFEITFNNMTDNSADLSMKWETTRVDFKISTEVDPIVMAQIQEQVIDAKTDNPSLLYSAASYYYNNEKDLDQAYEWITQSVESDPKYWTMHLKAKIELGLDKRTDALASAEKSAEMAEEANNPDYVRLNERLMKSIK